MVGLAIDAVQENEGDSLLDVEVPSNRPDCLSHIGIAREVSVIEKSRVQSPESKVKLPLPATLRSKCIADLESAALGSFRDARIFSASRIQFCDTAD